MALKRDEYWFIEGPDGKLIREERFVFADDAGVGDDSPRLFTSRKRADKHCFMGERPVKVRLVKVEEK